MRQEEHRLQTACVRYFRYRYPQLALCLIAVPNGGRRDAVTGAKLKAEGVIAGVSDLMLLVPSGNYHGLCIEMKTATGRQSEAQRRWQQAIEKQGYKYALARSTGQFMQEVDSYLADRRGGETSDNP